MTPKERQKNEPSVRMDMRQCAAEKVSAPPRRSDEVLAEQQKDRQSVYIP